MQQRLPPFRLSRNRYNFYIEHINQTYALNVIAALLNGCLSDWPDGRDFENLELTGEVQTRLQNRYNCHISQSTEARVAP